MKHILSAAALAIALAMAPGAHAAMMVLGAGTARECYEAARDQRHGASALQACNSALNDDILDSHNRAATLINRGILYQQRHDYENAIADFDAAIRIQPRMAEGYTNRGAALVAKENYGDAIASLNQALALQPAEPAMAFYNRAIAHEELGDISEAYEDYGRAAALAPDWTWPRRELARFRVEQR